MATINGSAGNDILFGTRKADIINGGGSRDYISAGGGDDWINGGLGNDILNGGKGFDTFFFGRLHDADVIEDFGPLDTIDLGDGIDLYFTTEVASGVRIATVDLDYTADLVQGSIILNGVTVDEWVSWGGAFGSDAFYVSTYSSGTLIV
jgi:Ca2+-binding RTX toxin-like protein